MASFMEGFAQSFNPAFQRSGERYQQQLNADREFGLKKQVHDAQMAEYQARVDQRNRENEAFDAYSVLDFSPEQQAQVTNTYGMNTGQMASAQRQGGLQAKLASYDQPDNHELQNAPAPRQFTAAGLQTQAPTEMQREQALGRISAAQRDAQGLRASAGNLKKIDLDQRGRAQFEELSKMPPEKLQEMLEPFNDDPNMKAMVDFDPKSQKFMAVSRVPGIPSQMLSKPEMVQFLMGRWMAGNGDLAAGMAAWAGYGQAKRGLENTAYDRSVKMAGLNADAHFKDRNADNDDARTRIAGAGLSLQRQQANKEDWSIIGPSDDGKSVLGFNKRSGKIEPRPLPEGTNAQNLFPKITGERDRSMTKQQELQARAQMKSAGYTDEQIETAITGVDPNKVLVDNLIKQNEARKAAGAQKPSGGLPARPPVTRTPEQQAYYDETVRADQERAQQRASSQQMVTEARRLTGAAIRSMSPQQAAEALQRLGPALGSQQRSLLQNRAQG